MDGLNYENYKIAFTTFKKYNDIDFFSHLNSTFSASPVFFSTMYKKLFMFLNQMILDLSTREFFLFLVSGKTKAPANSTKAGSEASL